ncbi:hypothetical protein [Thiolapillus sp.]
MQGFKRRNRAMAEPHSEHSYPHLEANFDLGILPRQRTSLQPDKAGDLQIAVLMIVTAIRDSLMAFRLVEINSLPKGQKTRTLRRRKARLEEQRTAREWLDNPDSGCLSLRTCFSLISEAWEEHYNYIVDFDEFHKGVIEEPRRILSLLRMWIEQ